MKIEEINEAIRTIKKLCDSTLNCIDCPMKSNCNEFPTRWDEVEDNDVR